MSTLHVENLKGLSSGSNANKIIVPSGQTLDASNGFTAPAGHVIQVVNGASSTDASYTSSSYTTIMQATITPKFTSSKILITYNFNSTWKNNTTAEGNWSIFRDSTNIAHVDGITPYNGTSTNNSAGSVAGTYLDSPNTSSAITYYGKLSISNGTVRLNTEGGVCAITLMEIAQ